jgi:hypothetical protein
MGEQAVVVPWIRIWTAEEAWALAAQFLAAKRSFSGFTAVGEAIHVHN